MSKKFLFNLCPEDRPLQSLSLNTGPRSSTGIRSSRLYTAERSIDMRRLFEMGDPSRAIDWKAYARTEQLYVHESSVVTQKSFQFNIDVSASMQWRPSPSVLSGPTNDVSKFSYSLRTALHLADLAIENEDAVIAFNFFDTDLNFWHKRIFSRSDIDSLYTTAEKSTFDFDTLADYLDQGRTFNSEMVSSSSMGSSSYTFSDLLSWSHLGSFDGLPHNFAHLGQGVFFHTLLSVELYPERLNEKNIYKPLFSSEKPTTTYDKNALCRDDLLKGRIQSWQEKLKISCEESDFLYLPLNETLSLDQLYDLDFFEGSQMTEVAR